MDRRLDLVIAVFVLGLGIAFFVLASESYGPQQRDPVGEGGLPQVLAIIMAGGSLWIIAGRLRTWRHESSHQVAPEGEEDEPAHPVFSWRPPVLWGLAAIYVAALPVVGFLIGTPLMLAAGLWTWGSRDRRLILGLAVGLTVVVFGLFDLLLGAALPGGIL